MKKPTVLITGGAGGLGNVATAYLVKKGWQVIVADINREALEDLGNEPGVLPVFIDVTNQESIDQALTQVIQHADGLDGIVNLTGILIVGSMAELPVEQVKHIFDVNVLGPYRVNKTFLPLIMSRQGRIINISSETGWQTAAPFNGPYALSKYALEAYNDALRREMDLLNIKVIKIRPGPFKSAMTASVQEAFRKAEADSVLFSKNLARGSRYLSSVYKKASEPIILAKVIHKALTSPRPKMAYSVKPDRLRSFLEKIPLRWADKVLKKAME